MRVLFFRCLGGGVSPAQTQKKEKTRPRPNSKNINTPPTLPSVVFAVWASGRVFLLFGQRRVFFAVWEGACLFFCCLGRGGGGVVCFCFCCLGRDVFCFFCCLGGGRVPFCCLGGCRVFFCCSGGEGGGGVCACFFCFFAVWAGDGNSLTYRSAWLVFKGPNNKKDQTAKTHGFQSKRHFMGSIPAPSSTH